MRKIGIMPPALMQQVDSALKVSLELQQPLIAVARHFRSGSDRLAYFFSGIPTIASCLSYSICIV